MSDKSKTTAELYRDLVNIEVKTLVHRVTEVSVTVDQIFNLFEDLALRLEEGTVQTEQNKVRLEMTREEISRLSAHIDKQIHDGREIFARLKALDLRVQRLENTAKE